MIKPPAATSARRSKIVGIARRSARAMISSASLAQTTDGATPARQHDVQQTLSPSISATATCRPEALAKMIISPFKSSIARDIAESESNSDLVTIAKRRPLSLRRTTMLRNRREVTGVDVLRGQAGAPGQRGCATAPGLSPSDHSRSPCGSIR
jgi:hypothetical protein